MNITIACHVRSRIPERSRTEHVVADIIAGVDSKAKSRRTRAGGRTWKFSDGSSLHCSPHGSIEVW